jgi:DNA-binding CsgD family transcriptional regulator
MGRDAAKLEANRLNRRNDGVTYTAEEHGDAKLENPWAVVGRNAGKPANVDPDQGAMFKRGNTASTGLSVTQIQRAVDKLTLNWLKKPDIHILESMEEAPGPVRAVWEQQNSQGAVGAIEGFHWKGGVYIVADRMESGSDIIRVLYHEAAHFGLRQVFGERLDVVLRQVAAVRPKELRVKANQYGFDLTNERQRLSAAEELLAELAQSHPENSLVQKAVAIIRQFFREHVPGFSSMGMTDAELIHQFIMPARNFVEDGKRPGPIFSRAADVKLSRRLLGKDGVKQAVAMYESGKSLSEIAAELDFSVSTIHSALKNAGTAMRPTGSEQTLGANTVDAIVADYKDGLSTVKLAEKFGIHASTVALYLERAGVDRRQPGPEAARVAEAKALYEGGLSLEEVGDQMGTTDTAIYNWLKGDGVQLRPPAGYSQDVKDEALRLYGEGMTTTEIARRLDLGEKGWAVRDWAAKAGIARTLSEATSLSVQNGRVVYSGINTPWQSAKTGRWEMAHSTYELLRMAQLDADESIADWSKKTPMVQYTDASGKQRTYVPDFLIEYEDGRTVVEEVKPEFQLSTPTVKAKLDAAREQFKKQGIEFRIVTQHDIGTDKIQEAYKQMRAAKAENAKALESPAPNSDGAQFSRDEARTIEVDGVRRPIENSKGQLVGRDFKGQQAFWRWFQDSRIVDDSGAPLVVFHGTSADIQSFDRTQVHETGDYGAGYYFTSDDALASGYAKKRGEGANVMPVYLSLRNPYVVNIDSDKTEAQQKFQPIKDKAFAEKFTGSLKAKGHDGVLVMLRDIEPETGEVLDQYVEEVVAFSPTQIKSALGNSGDFSPSDDRVQFSRSVVTGQTLPHAWQASDPTKMDNFIRAAQDKHIDTKRVLQSVRDAIGAISDEQDPYLQEELFHGRAAMATKEFLEKSLRPLLVDMQARGVDMSDFEEYLHNRHAERRNVQVAKVNPKMQDGGSGIKTADARAYLSGLPVGKKRAYEALAKRVDQINRETRDLLVSSGLEKQDTIDAWQAAYGDEYVPLMRDEMDDGRQGIGQGYSVRGSASKRAMGSDKPVANIIANIALQREKTITRANKRRIGEAVYGLALKAPNDDFWLVIDPALEQDANQITATALQLISMGMNPADAQAIAQEPTQRYIDPRTGQVAERINPSLRSADNVLAVRIDGEDKYVFFNAKDERAMRMATALKNLDADQLGTVMGTVAKMTRYFSAINTQYNPIFGVTNITRDVQTALLNLNSTPLKAHKAEVMKHILPALRGIYIDLRDHRAGKQPSSVWAGLFEEFQREGGATGYRDMYANSDERAESIAAELKAMKDGKAMQLGKGIMGWLSDYNQSMENAVRVAAYKVGKEQGLSNQQAASLAKNLTVNFNRKGQVALQAGALYAFFNASVQGTARLSQTMFEGGKLSAVGKKIMTGGLLLGAMQALLLAAAGFDDDEPPDFVRERSLVIPIGDKKYVSIPMPLGFHVIPNLGRIPTEWAMGGFKNTPKRIGQLVGLFADAFNPIGSAGLSLQTLTPTIIDPLAALSENKDFTGKPIARKDFDSLKPTAGHTRAKDTATPWAKLISYGVNMATGGTDYKPGLASPTPDQIDYLIGQVTGGVGREIGKLSQVGGSTLSGEEIPLYKIPLVGRFVGSTEGQAAEASRFYNNLREIGEHKAEIDGLRKDRKGAEAAAYLKENRQAMLVPMADKVHREVSRLGRVKRELIKAGASPERVKSIDAQITLRMKLLNDRVRALEERD